MTGLGSSCGACKFLRRKCMSDCVFAPYFCYDQAATHFAAVHKVFGASNVSKLLLHLPLQNRSAAAITISYEALARMRDPIYGCVAHIFALQQQVLSLQEEIEFLGTQMASFSVRVPQVSTNSSIKSSQVMTSQLEMMNLTCFQNQQAEAINNLGYTHTFGSQMNEQLDENSLPDFYTSPEIFAPWLDMDYNNIDMEGLSWN